jgi:hypothetical protein
VFAVICWAYFPVVFCLYPETSRRTLEDMDQIFIQNPSVLVFGKRDMTQRERPQAFVEAEAARIAEAETTEVSQEVLFGKMQNIAVHQEEV